MVADNNRAKSVIGHVTFTPREGTSFNLVGFAGPEQDDNNTNWRYGINFYCEHRWVPQLKTALQLDYGAEQFQDDQGAHRTGRWYAASLWLVYDPLEVFGGAVRGEILRDADGLRTSGAPKLAPLPANHGMSIYGATLTLNVRPVKGLRIAPELRWDGASLEAGAFEGKKNQVTLALGVAYIY